MELKYRRDIIENVKLAVMSESYYWYGKRIDEHMLVAMITKAAEEIMNSVYTKDDMEHDLLERKYSETNK